VETPRGLFELKYFFHSGIASDARSAIVKGFFPRAK